MAGTETDAALEPNEEAIRAWDGPLFDRFLHFKHLMPESLALFGDAAIGLLAPQTGGARPRPRLRVRRLDRATRCADRARRGSARRRRVAALHRARPRGMAAEHGMPNARFTVADIQLMDAEESYDLALSRFGTMFFANPVAAMRNVRRALRPGGRLAMAVWRRRTDNEWLYRAQTIVERIVERPTEYDEPTCGPGPFSMADADTTSDVMIAAGFADVALQRCDIPILIGRDLQEAIDFVTAIGPAGEILRLAGERAAHLHGQVHEELEQWHVGHGRRRRCQGDGLDVARVRARFLSTSRPRRPSGR